MCHCLFYIYIEVEEMYQYVTVHYREVKQKYQYLTVNKRGGREVPSIYCSL